jgi:DNA transformation protein and related proteins
VPNRPQYLEFLVEQFAIMGQIATRAMFGGHVLYCDGVPFALVADNAVYLKADEHNRPAFLDSGLRPFQPFPDKPGVMQYYQTPPEVFEDRDAMKRWAGGAIAAGRRVQAKKKPSKKKR